MAIRNPSYKTQQCTAILGDITHHAGSRFLSRKPGDLPMDLTVERPQYNNTICATLSFDLASTCHFPPVLCEFAVKQ
jgi:hypothetical protein